MVDHADRFPHPLYEKYVLRPFFEDARTYYYEPMLAANRAHVVMLHQCGIISHENAKALLEALRQMEAAGLDGLGYQSGVEDLFFTMENFIIQRVGAAHGGNLQLARSRNDLGYALTRLALRPLLIENMQRLLEFREVLRQFAVAHLTSLMPGYTHTQPAQPTTMAHYIAGVLGFLERDFQRVVSAYRVNNASPLGAAALTGTGFPIDRELSAALLGFDEVMQSTYDSIGSSDNLTDVAHVVSSIGANLSRFTRDMLFWATQESGAIRIHDSFIQVSSIMPQKRNPVVLEHIRARISRMLSYAHGVVIQCHNIPFGDTQDIEDEIFPLLFGSLHTTADVLHLYAAVMETLHVNVDHLAQRASAGFTTVTELADTLVREAGLPFRQAHHVVSGIVNYAAAHQLAPEDLTTDILATVSQERIGQRITLSAEQLQHALNPRAFVDLRQSEARAGRFSTERVVEAQGRQLEADRRTLTELQSHVDQAAALLQREVATILA